MAFDFPIFGHGKPETRKVESTTASATESECFITFGSGIYELVGATVWHDEAYCLPAQMQFTFKNSDGTYGYYVSLASGFCNRFLTLNLPRTAVLATQYGAALFSKMGQVESQKHKMNCHYRKLSPYYQGRDKFQWQ